MRGQVIAVMSGKGGVGKTTVAANLAACFSHYGNQRVIVVELDAALRCQSTIFDLCGPVVFDVGDALSGRCSVEQAVFSSRRFPTLFLLSAPVEGSLDCSGLPSLLQSLTEMYDLVFLDAPAGLGEVVQQAASLAAMVLYVVTPDPVSVSAACSLHRSLPARAKRNTRFVINRVDVKRPKKNVITDFDAIIDELRVRLAGVLPQDDAVAAFYAASGKQSFFLCSIQHRQASLWKKCSTLNSLVKGED